MFGGGQNSPYMIKQAPGLTRCLSKQAFSSSISADPFRSPFSAASLLDNIKVMIQRDRYGL